MTVENLSKEELDERVAILKRFRALLEQQRTKFREYLKVLESQEKRINAEDAESLLAHTEPEKQIVKGIASLQKVIVPMQDLYVKSRASTYNPQDAVPVEKLQGELGKLREQVIIQNQRNRHLLKIHLEELRGQISGFKNPYKGLSSVYAERKSTGSLVSVEA